MKHTQGLYTSLKGISLFLILHLPTGCTIKKIDMTLPEPLVEFKEQQQSANKLPEKSLKTTAIPKQILSSLTIDKLPPLTEEQTVQLNLPKEKTAINVDAMPLNDFIHLALGEVLGLSFEMDAQISKRKDPVTLHISKSVEASRLLGMVEQLLAAYDIFLAESPSGLRVMPFSKASKTVPMPVSEQSKLLLHSGRIMTIVPLRYTNPTEAISFMSQFLRFGQVAHVFPNTRLNALVIIGMPERIAAYKQAIALIDRSGFVNKKMVLIRPVYWQAEDLAKELKKLLAAQDIPVSDNKKAVGVKILTIEQTNSLVIISPEEKWMGLLDEWVKALDAVDAVGEENNSYIYFVKNSKAESLGEIIANILGEGSSSHHTKKIKSDNKVKNQEKNQEKPRKTSSIKSVNRREKKEKSPITSSSLYGGDLRVVADNERNVLIFTGTARAYRSAYNLLQRLDIEPRQILIEATVADISLEKSLSLGVDWGYRNTSGDNRHAVGTADPNPAIDGALQLATGGLSYIYYNAAVGIAARVKALAIDGHAKILSSPRILTKNNEEASIQVGTQVAVIGAEVSNVQASGGNDTSLLRSFTYVDTGVILTVTPTILDAGKVELKITQEVSEVKTTTSDTPPIFTRKVNTVLVAESGQTIMIGGLITNNQSVDETKVPLLGDIPWLGHLFSSVTRSDRMTNMVILITPHIINSSAEAVYLTNKFQEQMLWNEPEL